MGNNDSVSRLGDLLNKSLSALEDLDPLAFKRFIAAEKESFEYINSLATKDGDFKSTEESAVKRYFVSYNHTYKERFGFGNIITETNSFNIREIEKFIKAECNFSDVVILYYKEMEEDEK